MTCMSSTSVYFWSIWYFGKCCVCLEQNTSKILVEHIEKLAIAFYVIQRPACTDIPYNPYKVIEKVQLMGTKG